MANVKGLLWKPVPGNAADGPAEAPIRLPIDEAYAVEPLPIDDPGDPEYKKFWRRLVENPEKSKYNSEKEGLRIIGKDTKNVIVCDETLLLGYLKTNVNEHAPYLFAHDRWRYINLMLHKNSPMTPVLKHGVERLQEKGIEQQLRLKWIGAGEQDQGATLKAIVLNPGQVILIFAVMMVVYGVTLVLFCGEVVTSWMRDIP